MLREIPFYLVVFAPYIFLFVAIMGVVNLLNRLTAKPKAPPYVPTPEEKAASMARSLEMFAQTTKSRLENARTPKETERAMADLVRLQALQLENAHHH